jgi:L-ascorbate metabolism protein UlaG (beta-lactamase superfamily)
VRLSAGVRYSLLWRRLFLPGEPPEVPKGHQLSRQAVLESLIGKGGGPSITWLGHAAFLVRMGGKTVLLDPYLGRFASPLGPLGVERYAGPGLAVGGLPPIDVLLVSHNHYDHLDEATIAALPGKAWTTVLAPLRLGDFFRERGYGDVRELDWHDVVKLGDLRITALPMIHWSRRGLGDTNSTLWMGALLEAGGYRLLFLGDTSYGPLFHRLGERYGPVDLALVPIGAYDPPEMMAPLHVNPEEAVQIGRDLKADAIMGHHWGTVVLSDTPPFEPPKRFRAAAKKAGFDDKKVWILRIGETRALER